MSITTWGWGSCGGTISINGWGGCPPPVPGPPPLPPYECARLWIIEAATGKLQQDTLSLAHRNEFKFHEDNWADRMNNLLRRIRALEHQTVDIVKSDKELERKAKHLVVKIPYERKWGTRTGGRDKWFKWFEKNERKKK